VIHEVIWRKAAAREAKKILQYVHTCKAWVAVFLPGSGPRWCACVIRWRKAAETRTYKQAHAALQTRCNPFAMLVKFSSAEQPKKKPPAWQIKRAPLTPHQPSLPSNGTVVERRAPNAPGEAPP
jgi:hypothetical protein